MPVDLGERTLVWGRLRAGSGLCPCHRTSACPSQSASGLYCPPRRTWPNGFGFQGPSASAEPGNRPTAATVSSGQPGWLCPWGAAPSLREPWPVSWGSPLGPALGRTDEPSGARVWPLQAPGDAEDRPWGPPSGPAGRAHLPARLHLLSVAGPSPRVNSLGLPGNHAGGRARASGLTGTGQRGRGGAGRGGGGGCPWETWGWDPCRPPLPPLLASLAWLLVPWGERTPGEGSLGLGAASCRPQTLFVSSGSGADPPQCPGFSEEAAELAGSCEPRNPSGCCGASVWAWYR